MALCPAEIVLPLSRQHGAESLNRKTRDIAVLHNTGNLCD